jgi:hypothetical protein
MVLIAICGEMGCHSEDTLAFTPLGFKKHTDLNVGDEVYGMDKKCNFKRTKILKKFEYDYKGKLLHFFSDNYDFLVTPNHNMLIKLSAKSQWQYIKASELVDSTLKGVIYFSSYFWNICEEKFGSKNITSEKYTGKVWCFETELGNFFTTRNGKISVSGNSGKSLSLTYLAYRKYLKGMTVFANYHITFPTFENFKAPDVRYVRKMEDVLNMREGFFAGDELWLNADSRMSATKKNRFVTSILAKSRKRNIHIGYTIQNFHQIDKRIRDVTDFIAFPQLNKDESICRLEVMTLPSMTPMQTYKFRTAPLFKMFNTSEEVEPFESEEDEKKKKEEAQPAPESEDDYKKDALEDDNSDVDL